MKRDVPVKLEHIIDVVALKNHIEAGNVSVQKHPLHDLRIFNYTPQAVYNDNGWDKTLSLCRGLIVNRRDEVIARPFAKFWNLNTAKRPETFVDALPKTPFQIMQKMDGSLGILYDVDEKYAIATRGSFQSDQAKWATAWYRRHVVNHPACWPEGWTPLFEIIYPENRIVCSYEYSALVLIGLINVETGEEMAWTDLQKWAWINNLRVAHQVVNATINELLSHKADNEEGWVMTWFDPYIKVKVKLEEYVRLHRIVTGFNPKTVWEMLSERQEGKVQELMRDQTLPLEFRKWLLEQYAVLTSEFNRHRWAAEILFGDKPSVEDRKTLALYFTGSEHQHLSAVLFAMLDGKEYAPIIWKMIKPRGDKAYKVDGEA